MTGNNISQRNALKSIELSFNFNRYKASRIVITAPYEIWGEVMCLHLSVILSKGDGCLPSHNATGAWTE